MSQAPNSACARTSCLLRRHLPERRRRPGVGDELLKKIARELVDCVRRNATIDWTEKEQMRARMRATIRRLLTRYGFSPDLARPA